MNGPLFAERTKGVHRSFIREILKVTERPEVISFAGGLPNPALFPVDGLAEAARKVFMEQGGGALQYSTTEGYAPLREWIAARYRNKRGLDVLPDEIIITTGSQQCLDLTAKCLVDRREAVLIERPGYLGAIQAMSFFGPEFVSVRLEGDGPDIAELQALLATRKPRLFYAVTNFQNPSGQTYSMEKRRLAGEILSDASTVLLEDDPYGELRYAGEDLPPLYAFCRGPRILLGSFSKIAAPGLRLGWAVCGNDIREKLITAKQAADLHTSSLTQRIMYEFLNLFDIDEHIEKIRERYGAQCKAMIRAAAEHFPPDARITEPEGGMFLWVELPAGLSSLELFERAVTENVAFVPGTPFFADGSGENTLRLNFSNTDEEAIDTGIRRLGRCMEQFFKEKGAG